MSRTKATKRPSARATTPKAATAKAAECPTHRAVKAAMRSLPMPAHIARPRGSNAAEEPEWAAGGAGTAEGKNAPAGSFSTERKRGRPQFAPTADHRRQVETLAGLGIPQAGIASMITNPHTGEPIEEKTLRQHFERELVQGVHKANGAIAQSLYQKAMGNGHQSVAAAIFYLKCRAGWRERVEVAVDIKGGVLVPPSSMTPEQWIAAQAALNASRAEPGKNE